MAIITTTNYSLASFKWATADSDPISRADQVAAVAQALENHDHSSGLGVPIARVQTVTAPAALGEVMVNVDTFQFYGSSLHSVSNSDHTHGAGFVQVQDRSVTAVVQNTVTTTTVYSYSVPGGTLGTSKGLRLTLFGDYACAAGGTAVAINILYGGVTAWTSGAINLSTVTRGSFMLTYVLQAINSAAAQLGIGELLVSGVAEGGAGASPSSDLLGSSTLLTVNSAINQTFAVQFVMSGHAGTDDVTFRSAVLELV